MGLKPDIVSMYQYRRYLLGAMETGNMEDLKALKEVHSGVLSPKSIEFLTLIGLDCFEPKQDG